MLKKLDTIPWKDLKHAYGSAEDVPGIIRDLLSDDEDCREEAIWELFGNMDYHQLLKCLSQFQKFLNLGLLGALWQLFLLVNYLQFVL